MKNLNLSNFKEEIKDKIAIVDFWTEWCGPCKALAPIFEELSKELTNINFYKLNVDENQGVAEKYGIMSIPTLIVFKDGKIAEQLPGFRGKEEIKEIIQKHI